MRQLKALPFIGFFLVCLAPGGISSPLLGKAAKFMCPSDGFFAEPDQCVGYYYVCLNGVSNIVNCPNDKIFDPITLQCTTPDSASCKDFTCPSDGNFAIPGACSADYYICVGGDAYLTSCPGNTIFDPATNRCTDPSNVSCLTTTLTQMTTTSAPFTCPADGNWPIDNTCRQDYYICVGGTVYEGRCPSGTVFDPVAKRCASSCSVDTTTTTTAKPFTCEADGYFPIPGQCSSNYYLCIDGQIFEASCPGGAIFDPATYICTPAGSASCSNNTSSTSSTVTTTSPTPTYTTPTIGTPTTQSTTTITTQENTSSSPIYTTTATTTTASTTPANTSSPTPASTTGTPFTCPSPNGNFPNPDDCNAYYTCSNNIPIPQACPPGLVYNPIYDACDFTSPTCPGK